MENLTAHIDQLLDEHRPERYSARDKTWRDPVYDEIRDLVPEARAREIAAEQMVDGRETQATRTVNKLLRAIGQTRQWPLDWMGLECRPLSIGEDRVRLQDATAVDLRRWAIDERRDASQDHVARSLACDGAEWCADEMDEQGWLTFRDSTEAP